MVAGGLKVVPWPSMLTCWPSAVKPTGAPDGVVSTMVSVKSSEAEPAGMVICVMVTSLDVALLPVARNAPRAAVTGVWA
jgi:hypothetical protein